jgi:hypothetical protein
MHQSENEQKEHNKDENGSLVAKKMSYGDTLICSTGRNQSSIYRDNL